MSVLASIVFCNVGQGDSIAMRLSTGQIVVVDCNIPTDAREQRPPILAHLERWWEERGSSDIDLLCLTHPDYDHYHGMLQVIKTAEGRGGRIRRVLKWAIDLKDVNNVLALVESALTDDAEQRRLSRKWNELRSLLLKLQELKSRRDTRWFWASGRESLLSDGGVELLVLGPDAGILENHAIESLRAVFMDMASEEREHAADLSANELSALILVKTARLAALLTGDATHESLSTSVRDLDRRVQLLKLPHHGSLKSSSAELWQQILDPAAAYVVVSAGNHAGYRHPNAATIEHVKVACPSVRLFCTNICPMHSEQRTKNPRNLKPARLLPSIPASALELHELLWPAEQGEDEYHGDCIFEFMSDGAVRHETERTPLIPCALHT
jgi:hypothetical protein